jgi:hypothetical protein
MAQRPPQDSSISTGWFTVAGQGHLFFFDPQDQQSRPVCGAEAGEPPFPSWVRGEVPVCDDCDTYLRDVFVPQIS